MRVNVLNIKISAPGEHMTELTSPAPKKPNLFQEAFSTTWQVIQLKSSPYRDLLKLEQPSRHGFVLLLIMLTITGLAVMLGVFFDWLTLPRFDLLQQDLYNLITGNIIYESIAAENPNFAGIFNLLYGLLWMVLRISGTIPNAQYAVLTFFNFILTGLFDWLTYAFILMLLARWFGGKPPKPGFWGVMALAFTPKLMAVANLLPGAAVMTILTRSMIIAASYVAVQSTCELSPKRAAAAVLLAPILNFIFILLAILLGVLLGVAIYLLIT